MELNDIRNPLREDEDGAIRVGNTRVLFDLVVRSYQNGHVADEIARYHYTTLSVEDTYAAIAFYLQNKEQVESYLKKREEEAAELKAKIIREGYGGDADDFLTKPASKTVTE